MSACFPSETAGWAGNLTAWQRFHCGFLKRGCSGVRRARRDAPTVLLRF